MAKENEKRPLWYVMLLFLSVLPIVVWFVAFQRLPIGDGGTMRFLMTVFPFYVFGVIAMAYYVYPSRREVAWILIALAWLSYISLAALIWLAPPA